MAVLAAPRVTEDDLKEIHRLQQEAYLTLQLDPTHAERAGFELWWQAKREWKIVVYDDESS